MHILRTAPVWQNAGLRVFDQAVRGGPSKITNVEMTDTVWNQASLPTCMGSLGTRRTEDIAHPAFMASLSSVGTLIQQILPSLDMENYLTPLIKVWSHKTSAAAPELRQRGFQKAWDKPIAQVIANYVTSQLDDIGKAR